MSTWCPELFFGGARGGGKSDYLLGDFLQDVERYKSNWHGVLFRRTLPELEEIQKRALELYPQTGADYGIQKSTWKWPNGATLKLRYLERVADVTRYQGHQYTWIGWDELGTWQNADAYKQIKACLRSAADVPTKRIRATGNPGGVGHHWVKDYFIDAAPAGYVPIRGEDGQWKMFIPSRVQDNQILLLNDPQYIERLKGIGSPELVRAWLEGDWSVVTGAYFTEFSIAKHVIAPQEWPADWLRFRSFDWGSARPFSVGWWCVSDGIMPEYPRGAIIRYREWYGASAPNTGLKMTAEEVADGILERELRNERIAYSIADPAIFKQDGGPSIAERMHKRGVIFRPGDNQRKAGWDAVRARLQGEDEKPMIYFTANCKDSIRTLPALQHDERKPEDIDTEAEDHAADEIRYAAMSRPYTRPKPVEKKMTTLQDVTLNDLWAANKPDGRYKRL